MIRNIGSKEERNDMFLSTWEWIRVLGFVAYFYFTASIVFGLLRKTPNVKKQKNLLYQLHQSAGWFGIVAVIAHMLLLILDRFEPYSIVELLIPFASDYKPLLSGLGTIAFYLFLIVMITSDLWIQKMKFPMWKKLHLIVLPAWIISFIHGVLIGTDTDNPIVQIIYWSTFMLVVITFFVRHLENTEKNKEKVTSDKPTENH